MKFSPCGWFCFDEPAGWVCADTPESILLSHPPSGAVIEVTSARRDQRVRQSEMWALLEKSMLNMPGAEFEETSMYRLPGNAECLRSVQSNSGILQGLAFAFWSRYCIQVKLQADTEAFRIDDCIRGLSELLESIQVLTTD
jgi:hypothetical protein